MVELKRDNSGNAVARAMEQQPANADARTRETGSVLESGIPLSRSLIWQRQREFYARRGLGAWSGDKVPQFITNNPFIAEVYARIVLAFLLDCRNHAPEGSRPLATDNPLRILELGAGTGKFAYLFLRHIGVLLRENGIPEHTVRYTMTDCAPNVVDAWRNNRYLAELSGKRLLDFAVFAAGDDVSLLQHGAHATAPLIVIANYVFDSLPQDAFSIQNGNIEELLLSTTGPGSLGSTANEETPLRDLQFSFQAVPVSRGRYENESWNTVLDAYRHLSPRATLLFPSGALGVLEQLASLSEGRMMVLAADKGDVYEDTLALAQGPPAFEWHAPECFSLMTNFDAIGKTFSSSSCGGEALLPDKHFSKLHVCAFLRGLPVEENLRTRSAYRDALGAFGNDDLFNLLAWLNSHMEEIKVAEILSTLKLSRWDPIAFMRLFPVLGRQLRTVTAERTDLRHAVLKTWENHFPVTTEENVLAFQGGVVLLELRFFEDAARMFRSSQQELGPSAPTSYNLGLCALGLGHQQSALVMMREAVALDPGFEPARRALARLESAGGQPR